MIYDDQFFDIEDQVALVTGCLRQSTAYQDYVRSQRALSQDGLAMELKQNFQEQKHQFEKIAQYGAVAPDYREKQRSVRLAKRALDMNEKVAAFRIAETQLQGVLDQIGLEIAETISQSIKVDAGNPFFETGEHSGCRGNCHAS